MSLQCLQRFFQYEHVGPTSQQHKEAKGYMMMFRDYDWMMISKEAQRSQYKSKSKERASQVKTGYELKSKDKQSMLGL